MKGFSGFPDGKQRITPVPNRFFSDLLPIIDNLAELKVTLYAFWALTQKEGPVRYLRLPDFLNDPTFVKGMGPTIEMATDALLDGIERAVARGTFLHINIEAATGKMDYYFLNTEKGRASVEGITRGEWRPMPDQDAPVSLLVERPNIYILYEQNIGPLTPLIADELRDAEQTYPPRWIEDAIKAAVENNVRKWRYILKILEGWRQEGRQEKDGIHRRDSQKNKPQVPDDLKDIIKR
ncbi:MAG: DnaD domain protein [Anaerolineales bacterium]|nr:DnaD domain protein [Anaerolineales bacterium]